MCAVDFERRKRNVGSHKGDIGLLKYSRTLVLIPIDLLRTNRRCKGGGKVKGKTEMSKAFDNGKSNCLDHSER